MMYLQILAQDFHPYVRRRARNQINYIKLGEHWDIYQKRKLYRAKFSKRSSKNCTLQKSLNCELCFNSLTGNEFDVIYTSAENKYCICENCFLDFQDEFQLTAK